jgi:type IV secretory pathway VirJ component
MPASDKALPALPEIAKVPPRLVQCFYGADEADTICPELAKTGVAVFRAATTSAAVTRIWRASFWTDGGGG